ncbi:MAG TPA: hypothetical protein VKB79_04240 [Bryobacteraceae bacterium]|nr:hypothetical protein [Bryobacteraceae bacterium]
MRVIALSILIVAAAYGAETAPPFEQRKLAMIDAYAHYAGPGDQGYGEIAARLWKHENADWCSRKLQDLLAAPTGDMFWMFPVTAIAYLDQGQLSASARQALHHAWQTYMPYRGDTENHFLLYYTSLYLMSQLWPDQEWYTGKSSAENMEEARQWIESWVRITTTRGQGEYDSPHYMGVYLLPLSYLSAWAKDPAMKKRATMMLDYLIADYAPENLDGLYVGAHARIYEDQLVERWKGVSSDFGWLWFGAGRPLPFPDNYVLYYLVASAYEPPEILKRIGTDRSKPYTHYERKRTRNRWRFNDELNGPVYKTTYVRQEYAVGSDQGGILQPIQEHSWDVTWSVPDARGVQNTFFFVQPYSSVHELQTYFVFAPDAAIEGVVQSKKTYDSPDKLLGGSPYEKIVQDQDALIALYNIPSGTRFPHINGFFSKDLSEVREDPSGWIFMKGGNSAWIACRPLQPYSWKPIEGGGKRLFSPELKNGVVVQVAAASEYPDLEAFGRSIKALPLEIHTDPVPRVVFRSLRGSQIDFTYGETPKINGAPIAYEHWPLFGGPFLEAAVDSEQLTIHYGTMRRVLDFRTLTVRDSGN